MRDIKAKKGVKMLTIYRIRKQNGEYLPIPRLSQAAAELGAMNHAQRTTSDTEVVQDCVEDLAEVLAEIQTELGVSEHTARVLLADANF